MPLKYIPNQPVIFEQPIGDYPCLNNDNKAYAQLVQDGDTTCIQWELEACTEPMCEPNMVMPVPGADELGAWTTTGGWSSTGSDNLTFDGTGNPGGLPYNVITSIANTFYRVRFNVTNYTGTATYRLTWQTSTFTFTEDFNVIGQYTFYFQSNSTTLATILFQSIDTTTVADQLTIEDLEVVQWTNCWKDDLYLNQQSWSYSFDGINGKFCSSNSSGGDLINTTAFTTTGNYHGVQLTISNCTAGGLEVYIGSVLIGTTSGNGIFNFYGTPTSGTDLVFTKVDNFDGCISQVTVYDFGDLSIGEVTIKTEDNLKESNPLIPTAFDNRLVVCIDWENVTWSGGKYPTDCEPLKIEIKDPCEDQADSVSINRILYKKGGTWDCTKLVESWNDGYAFGFYFGDIASPDFKLTQRLRFLAFNPVYKNSGEEYLYSSGNSGRSFAQSQKARTAWFDYMDEYAHDCTRTQLLGQKLLVEGYSFYYPTEDYEPEWNERGAYNLAQSRVTLLHEEAIFGSTCGTLANTVCPPQVIQLPAAITQVGVNIDSFDLSGLDLTDVYALFLQFDNAGVNTSGALSGSSPYDLTNGAQRTLFVNDIANEIDTVYGTTVSSATCTLSGSLLSLNIICNGSVSTPMPALSVSIFDGAYSVYPFSIPIIFS